ncbi:sigma-54-dependent Fis family transcriptional regulator [Chelatococcus asaccharovorans]|uniref:sigma-54-dependent Fis family transcriptional regulator n=1 Tax=Chelatococcus asaccharovorans TaxID=28210 RepID=UPI00224C7BDB|nr:sigma-54-dependent Fis family transcriptional regulator [Chelatococcus asaccharovorans]CAH1652387.1 Transcriptional regulator of acetoin/glycerol metabolism [Chelatococcus asaccharovorans]CAH1693502.1 Transcriptional regulator of acetoin/glycerol metabolism [Chelatococcus asaccharovorans]
MNRQREMRHAWEAFLGKGEAPPGLPSALVASWMRSRALGVSTSRREAPISTEPEIYRRRSISKALLSAARPALNRSGLFLAEASSMMILTDASGFIVETAGDPRIVDNGRRNHLETGGRWDEAVIGTNAIGTALVDGKPTEIRGAAHFCEDVQRWTCAATPVRHPLDGEILGVVDISGPVAHFNPQSLALAMSIGQEIEATLGQAARTEHELLLRGFVSKRSIWLSEDILVIDKRGFVVHAAEGARRRLDADPDGLKRELRQIIGSTARDDWEENCRRRFPNASVEIVQNEGDAIGCLIVMHRPRGRPAAPQPKETVEPGLGFDSILGGSAVIAEARMRARKLGANSLPILIEGETGVGKELFARAIKSAGPAADGPFVPLNCGGMPRDLIASELFGYAKGAFTGADANGRAGRIEQADGGVLCLDEIGEMPLDLQSYLLRVLEDGIVYRIGEAVGRRVDIRILSMTNRDLGAEVEAGRFRRDLYYRIAAARLRIPPLRERREDIATLALSFAAKAAGRLGRPAPDFAPALLERLTAHDWPGNARELRNVVDAMVALAETDRLECADLPPELALGPAPGRQSTPRAAAPCPAAKADLRAAERAAILAQVEACGGNLTEAAKRLGIARSTLYLKLAEYRAAPSSER